MIKIQAQSRFPGHSIIPATMAKKIRKRTTPPKHVQIRRRRLYIRQIAAEANITPSEVWADIEATARLREQAWREAQASLSWLSGWGTGGSDTSAKTLTDAGWGGAGSWGPGESSSSTANADTPTDVDWTGGGWTGPIWTSGGWGEGGGGWGEGHLAGSGWS
ncbi:hypothetical protein DFH06DRAFT_1127057 [Mycena polygramma]|nr:hypothetical protein DFH06DRAFT_1127057 [Mycena polygramma]